MSTSMSRHFSQRRLLLLSLASGLSAMVYGQAPGTARADNTRLDALLKAAKAEGELMFYSSQPPNTNKRFADAFTAKFGIKASFLRLSSATLLQRFASEAASNNTVADLIMVPIIPESAFLAEATKNKWIVPVTEAGVPGVEAGQYPKEFLRGPAGVLGIIPFVFAYNTDKVQGAMIPRLWTDLLNPRWKNQILLTLPQNSIGQLDIWALLLDTYGQEFYDKLRAQNPRPFNDVVRAVQALAAGEGSIELMTSAGPVADLKAKGAPVDFVLPSLTTGAEMGVHVVASERAKHPNAARLMVQYLISKEGNNVFNDDPGSYSIYDQSGLPKDYRSPKPGTQARKDEIARALGL